MAVILLRKFRHWLQSSRIRCNIFAGIIATAIFAPLTYWTVDRTPPYELTNGYTVPSDIRPGHEFRIAWTLRKLTEPVDGYAQVRIIDSQKGVKYMAAEHSTIGREGKVGAVYQVEGRPRIMPDSVACGPATIQVHATYFGNPVRRYVWPVRVDRPPVSTNIVCHEPLAGPQGPQGIQGIQGEKGEPGKDGN